MSYFSKQLKLYKQKNGMASIDLANLLGTDAPAISKLLSGKRKPSLKYLKSLERKFDHNTYKLLCIARIADKLVELGFDKNDLDILIKVMK